MNDTGVRLAIYDGFLKTGHAPSATGMADSLETSVDDVRAAMERLHTGKAIVLQPESREVLMANPFCEVPSPYQVRSGDQTWFASCAWDSLGIMAMLETATSLHTSCPCCGESMSLEAAGRRLAPAPGIIHFALPALRWWHNIVFT